MPYIPPPVVEDTVFPFAGNTASSADLTTINRLLKEKWARFFPIVTYYPIKYTPTMPEDLSGNYDPNSAAGDVEGTLVDDLWGEDINAITSASLDVVDLTVEAIGDRVKDSRIYESSVEINAAVQMQPSDRTLKRFGIDKMKEVLFVLLCKSMDESGFSASNGDKIVWRGEEFEVTVVRDSGYWQNTNVFLYSICGCERKRQGT